MCANIAQWQVTQNAHIDAAGIVLAVAGGEAIPSEAFRIGLQYSILELGAADAVGSRLVISDKFVWAYIEAARTFLAACDY